MSERFIRLYELQNNSYSVGSPVIVSAGALLKDTQTNNIIVQLKFQSVSVTPIKALKVGIVAFDIAGKEIEGVDEYQYLDLKIQNGQEFGSNKAIVMPDAVTRSFSVRNITVVLENGNVQDVSMPMTILPKGTLLQSGLKDAEMVKQYKLSVNDKAAYIPQETNDLWMCSCGEWNIGDFCTRCRAKRTVVFSAYDIPALTDKMTSRLVTEQAQREEQQRIAEIERQREAEEEAKCKALEKEKRKKNKKRAKIATAVFAALLLLALWQLWLYPDVVQTAIQYNRAIELMENGDAMSAAITFSTLGDYKDAKEQVYMCWSMLPGERLTIATGNVHTVGVKSNSTVVATKYTGTPDDYDGQCDVAEWKDIVAVSASRCHTIGLKLDGTVVAVGYNGDGQCDVSEWTDIVAVSTGEFHTVGLKSDGTVVATKFTGSPNNYRGQCDVSDWTDIVAVSAGSYHTVGLKSDGTVVATEYTGDSDNYDGQCDVSEWTDIVAISAGWEHTVGLKADGTVVAVGSNKFGQCDVSNWANIVSISAGTCHTVGLKSDGTVVSTQYIDIYEDYSGQCDVNDWTDIVAINAGSNHTVGLKPDGTVISTKYIGWEVFNKGECDVNGWTDIRVPIQ